jgi:ankyrin repeat protein
MLSLGFAASPPTSRAGARADTPLHAAIWRGRTETVKLLVARGAPLEAQNGKGETPLAYAVRAVLGSEWTYDAKKRAQGALDLDVVKALLAAGADRARVALPAGYGPLDALFSP